MAERYWYRDRRLTDAEICERYAEGASSIDVGLLANCSSTTVLDVVRKYGVAVRSVGGSAPLGRRKLSDADVCLRYLAGHTAPRLARTAGCCTATVYRILRDGGIPTRRR